MTILSAIATITDAPVTQHQAGGQAFYTVHTTCTAKPSKHARYDCPCWQTFKDIVSSLHAHRLPYGIQAGVIVGIA